jgi:bifunctional non-homologous end joining protein LigD
MKVKVEDKELSISNLGKFLFPGNKTTKARVIKYYLEVANAMLPHLYQRPVTMKRYPDGTEGESFFEKRCPDHAPDWVNRIKRVRKGGEEMTQFSIDNRASLVWAANLASIEIHTVLSRGKDHEKPTMILFDLDPRPDADLEDCRRIALELRERFKDNGLKSFVKTTGGSGLHVLVPLNNGTDFDSVKDYVKEAARGLDDDMVSLSYRKEGKTVLIDWRQNSVGRTMIAPYSLRGGEKPLVSAPVTWEEVEEGGIEDIGINEIRDRLDCRGDLFRDLERIKQEIP